MNRQLASMLLAFAAVGGYVLLVVVAVAFADPPPPGHKTCKGCVTVGETTTYFEITCPVGYDCCGYTNSGGNPDVYCRNPNLGPNHPDYREECLPIAYCAAPDPL